MQTSRFIGWRLRESESEIDMVSEEEFDFDGFCVEVGGEVFVSVFVLVEDFVGVGVGGGVCVRVSVSSSETETVCVSSVVAD